MAFKRKVEIFTAGCPICENTVKRMKDMSCKSCEVITYDLNEGCETNECRDLAKKYGITRIPAIVVDEKLLDCCKSGGVSEERLRKAGVGVV